MGRLEPRALHHRQPFARLSVGKAGRQLPAVTVIHTFAARSSEERSAAHPPRELTSGTFTGRSWYRWDWREQAWPRQLRRCGNVVVRDTLRNKVCLWRAGGG